jgi:hypothetical protein
MNAFFAVDIKERTENSRLSEEKIKIEEDVLFYLLVVSALLK